MKKTPNSSRVLALLTAGVLSAGVMLQPAPARADKAKNYKYGAIALGAVGAYLLSKGKTVEGAAVLGAGAYTYKKGEDARKADDYNYGDYRDRYGYRNDNNDSYGTRYDDRYNYGNYDARDSYNAYNVPARNRLGDRDGNRNSSYRAYRNGDRDRYDYRNDDRYRDRYNERYDTSNRNPKIR